MKILSFSADNFRTLLDFKIEFEEYYSAISGKNDAGKSNITRAFKFIFKDGEQYYVPRDSGINVSEDYPKWLAEEKEKNITIQAEIQIFKNGDAGLYEFLVSYLNLSKQPEDMIVKLILKHSGKDRKTEQHVIVQDVQYSDLNAQEIFKKFQTSTTILFYNSTENVPRWFYGYSTSHFAQIATDYSKVMEDIKEYAAQALKKIAKTQQEKLTGLVERLERKYKVNLSVRLFDIEHLPVELDVSDGKVSTTLDNWGSGTKNRTMLLMMLLKASQIAKSETSASKVTPVLIVEEPESFLHPAAQSEFGRLIQDLSEDLQVQIIVVTHNPHFLSKKRPTANFLLERREHYNQLFETQIVDTNGQDWMKPFGKILGLDDSEIKPWYDIFFSMGKTIILVEGDLDKQYLQLMMDASHEHQKLEFDGEVFACGGVDNFKNTLLIKFLKDRSSKFLILFDMDRDEDTSRFLEGIGLVRGVHFISIGKNAEGCTKCIEDLVSNEIKQLVYKDNINLVNGLMSGEKKVRDKSKCDLKKKMCEELGKKIEKKEHFQDFYDLTKKIRSALKKQE